MSDGISDGYKMAAAAQRTREYYRCLAAYFAVKSKKTRHAAIRAHIQADDLWTRWVYYRERARKAVLFIKKLSRDDKEAWSVVIKGARDAGLPRCEFKVIKNASPWKGRDISFQESYDGGRPITVLVSRPHTTDIECVRVPKEHY